MAAEVVPTLNNIPIIKPTPNHPAAILGNVDNVVKTAIADDMRIRGYKGPSIKMLWNPKTKQWEKIDGRHREQACIETGTSPEYENIKLDKGDTPDRYVLRTHHMREIRRMVRLMYAIEMNPKLSITQILKLAGYRQGGRASFTVEVLRAVKKDHPDIWHDLKTHRGRKKLNFKQVVDLVGLTDRSKSHFGTQKYSLRERYEEIKALYTAAKREITQLKGELAVYKGLNSETCHACAEQFQHGPWCAVIIEAWDEVDDEED